MSQLNPLNDYVKRTHQSIPHENLTNPDLLQHYWERWSRYGIVAEQKFDGRLVFDFFSEKNGIKMATRPRNNTQGQIFAASDFPLLFAEHQHLVRGAGILHGELIPEKGTDRAVLHLHDVIFAGSADVRTLDLNDRKNILANLIPQDGEWVKRVRPVPVTSQSQILDLYNEAVRHGQEGIVLKANVPYTVPNSWAKLKKMETCDVVVKDIKVTDVYTQTGVPMTWDIFVYDENGQEVDVGSVSSCDAQDKFGRPINRKDIRPGMVLELRFQEVTENYKLRHPTVCQIRDDKSPDECRLEQLTSLLQSYSSGMRLSRFEEPMPVPKDRATLTEYILGVSETALKLHGGLITQVYCIFDRPLGLLSDKYIPNDTAVAMIHFIEPEAEDESPADGIQPVVDEEQPDGIVFVAVGKSLTGEQQADEQQADEQGELSLMVAAHFKDYNRMISVPYSIVENQILLHEQQAIDSAKKDDATFELRGKIFEVKLVKESAMSPYG